MKKNEPNSKPNEFKTDSADLEIQEILERLNSANSALRKILQYMEVQQRESQNQKSKSDNDNNSLLNNSNF